MINRPFNPKSLSPIEELLLRRVEGMENALGSLALMLGSNFSFAKDAMSGLVSNATQGTKLAEELAAALYLADLTDPQGLRDEIEAHQLYTENQEWAAKVEAVANEYFPSAFGILHPLAFAPGFLLKDAEPAPLDGEEGLSFTMLQAAVNSGNPYYQTALLSDTGKPVPTLLFKYDDMHAFIVVPATGAWAVLTFVNDIEHYFVHHQCRVIEAAALKRILDEALVRNQPAKIRSYFKSNEDAGTALEIAISKLFAREEPLEEMVSKEGQYTFKVNVGQHQKLGPIISVQSPHSPLPAIISKQTPDMLSVLDVRGPSANGSHMAFQTKLDDLSAQSKALLLEVLAPLSKKK